MEAHGYGIPLSLFQPPPILEGTYSSWAVYDTFDEGDTAGTIDSSMAVFNRDETVVILGDRAADIRVYTIASKTLGALQSPGQFWADERNIHTAYGTYAVIWNATHLYVYKNGVLIQTFTDTSLGLDNIDDAHISPLGKYIAVAGHITASGNDGWVILVGS